MRNKKTCQTYHQRIYLMLLIYNSFIRKSCAFILSFILLSGCGLNARFVSGDLEFTGTAGEASEDILFVSSSEIMEEDSSRRNDYALVGIDWYEGNNESIPDQPCELVAKFRKINDAVNLDQSTLAEREVMACWGGRWNRSIKSVTVPPEPQNSNALRPIGRPLVLFANQIQTCNSDNPNNNRIKGIRLGGVLINGETPNPDNYSCTTAPNNSGTPNIEPCTEDALRLSEATHNECRGDWSEVQACPDGMIATGLRINIDSVPIEEGITGLSLECRRPSIMRR